MAVVGMITTPKSTSVHVRFPPTRRHSRIMIRVGNGLGLSMDNWIHLVLDHSGLDIVGFGYLVGLSLI